MNKDFKEFAWMVLIPATTLFSMLIGLMLMGNYLTCSAAFDGSAMQTRWGPLRGCQISRDGEVWIPAEAYRELDP